MKEIIILLTGTCIKLSKQSDFMDMDIVPKINKIIEDSGYRFESVSMNQVVCVVLLTMDEKTKIEKDRMIPFDTFDTFDT